MSDLRGEEEWARRALSRELGVPVSQNDDGSQDSMHDLTIEYPGRPHSAVEVTTDIDGAITALWNLVNGDGRWIEPAIEGGWFLMLSPQARAKQLRKQLPAFLQALEAAEVTEVWPDKSWDETDLERTARSLHITHAGQSDTEFDGSIYFSVEAPHEITGGMCPTSGEPLSLWCAEFLSAEEQADIRRKLLRTGAPERHAFLIVSSFAKADFGVTDLLYREEALLPELPPDLPSEITHVWMMSTWSNGHGIRWDPNTGWSTFDKLLQAPSTLTNYRSLG